MRCTTIAALLLGLTWSTIAEGGIINANNGLAEGQVGWTNVRPGDTLSILVTLTRETADSDRVASADISMSVTGPGAHLPTIAASTTVGEVYPLDMTGSGLLFAGGTPSGTEMGTGTSTVQMTANAVAPYPLFTSTSPYQLFRCEVTVPSNATPGLYTLGFNTSETDVIDKLGDPISLSAINGTISVVPEPATYAALASLLVGGASMWGWRRWRRGRVAPAPMNAWKPSALAIDVPAARPRSTRRLLRS
jgi:hypothetical protein